MESVIDLHIAAEKPRMASNRRASISFSKSWIHHRVFVRILIVIALILAGCLPAVQDQSKTVPVSSTVLLATIWTPDQNKASQ